MGIKTTKLSTRINRIEKFQEERKTRCPYCKKEIMIKRDITIENGHVFVSTRVREMVAGRFGHPAHNIDKCRVKALMALADYKEKPDLEICLTCRYFESGVGVDWMDMAFSYTKCKKYLLDTRAGRGYTGVKDVSPIGSCGNWEKKG